ncbi:hypothetical protein HanIR_Chr09g0449221 [Helianthus annuus]|nr:hypothetical protein HanIR_Chr09g0449221 [Helianthus annuus]
MWKIINITYKKVSKMHGWSLWFCEITPPIVPNFWKLHRCSLWFDCLLLG